MSAAYRPEVYALLERLDAGRTIPEDLMLWLPLCEVESLTHYTTTPTDTLPSSYPLVGEPTALYLELTDDGRKALARHRASAAEGRGR
jgi:hypothetical protein